jgi:hypothetical protein
LSFSEYKSIFTQARNAPRQVLPANAAIKRSIIN